MKCKSAEQLLPAYIEGVLSPKQVGQLIGHIEGCFHCQKELKYFEKTLRLANTLRIQYPSPEVWENFWPQLRTEIQQNQSISQNRIPLWVRMHAWKIASAVCLLGCLLGLWGLSKNNLFKIPIMDRTSAFNGLIVQSFMSDIPVKQLQEQLSRELQRTETTLAWRDEGLLMDEIQTPESAVSHDIVNQLSTVIAREIDIEDVEDEELTDLVSSMNDRFTFASLH